MFPHLQRRARPPGAVCERMLLLSERKKSFSRSLQSMRKGKETRRWGPSRDVVFLEDPCSINSSRQPGAVFVARCAVDWALIGQAKAKINGFFVGLRHFMLVFLKNSLSRNALGALANN